MEQDRGGTWKEAELALRVWGNLWQDGQCFGANPQSRADPLKEHLTSPGRRSTLPAVLRLECVYDQLLCVAHDLGSETSWRPIQTA